MKVSGWMTCRMGKESRRGRMELSMRERTRTGKRMVKEYCCLRIRVSITENFWIMRYQGMGNIIGVTGKYIRGNGKIIK
jgi:hypothetical protein